MDHDPLKPSWRKPFGMGVILLLILALAILVSALAGQLARLPWPLQAIAYLLLGLVWITPLKPLLRWMESGPRRR